MENKVPVASKNKKTKYYLLAIFYFLNGYFKERASFKQFYSLKNYLIVGNSFSIAKSKGSYPLLSFSYLFAPFSKSFLVNLTLPESADKCKEVIPISKSFLCISTPFTIKNKAAFSDLFLTLMKYL